MSKYAIEEYPQDQYRFRLYDNIKKLDWPAIQKEQWPDCVAAINLAYFALTAIPAKGVKAFDYQSAVMSGGKWLHKPIWHEYGICIDADGRMSLGTEDQATYDYAVGCPPVDINGRRYTNKDGGLNGWTYTGLKADGTVVVLICPKDTPMTTDALEDVMRQAGCVTIFRWDGSWSSRGTLGPGKSVTPSQYRCCRSWLLVFRRRGGGTKPDSDKEDKPMANKYTVKPSVGVNIRKGPSAEYAKVGGYSKGTVVTVMEERAGWGRTDLGWVKLSNLSLSTSSGSDSSATGQKTDTGVPIVQMLVAGGRKNRPGKANPCKWITIHETGNYAVGADAEAHGAYVRGDAAEASRVSWHYTVDDNSIVQHIPDNETAYHAGDGATGPGNTTSIGIEICVNKGGDFEVAKTNAASLVRLLMQLHNIPLSNVVQHNKWNGKDCPYTIRHTSGEWDKFLQMCKAGANVSNLDTDVDTLAAVGIAGNPTYWKGGKYSDENVKCLIRATAEFVRKVSTGVKS